MLSMLAITKANSTKPDKILENIHAVANPPGIKVYPGGFKKARELTLAGQDINYEGASGPCDLDASLEMKELPFVEWTVGINGNPVTSILSGTEGK
jgi:hypothetical protein